MALGHGHTPPLHPEIHRLTQVSWLCKRIHYCSPSSFVQLCSEVLGRPRRRTNVVRRTAWSMKGHVLEPILSRTPCSTSRGFVSKQKCERAGVIRSSVHFLRPRHVSFSSSQSTCHDATRENPAKEQFLLSGSQMIRSTFAS